MDKILINDLLVRCTIGVSIEERREKEDILISIILSGDYLRAGKSDQLEDAVDYRKLKKRIFALVEKSHYSLIEALAERVVSVCLATEGVSEVQVRVTKPSVLRFAKSVAVEMTRRSIDRKPIEVFLGLGSNIEPHKNILNAVELLREHVRVLASSKFYQTPALGQVDSPPFINGVIKVETLALPSDLKYSVLRPIEERLGRIRTEDKCAPRTIDIDILLYGDMAIKQEGLIIPDSEIHTRDFLAIPLAELAPDFILPGIRQSLNEIAGKFQQHSMKFLSEYTERVKKGACG